MHIHRADRHRLGNRSRKEIVTEARCGVDSPKAVGSGDILPIVPRSSHKNHTLIHDTLNGCSDRHVWITGGTIAETCVGDGDFVCVRGDIFHSGYEVSPG